MPANYLGIGIFLVLSLVFASASLYIAGLLSPRRPDTEKLSTYECGCEPFGNAKERSAIRFYVFAMLFVIFDVETSFLMPWAVVYDKIGLLGFIEMMLFLVVLIVGYIYAWKKGALEWV